MMKRDPYITANVLAALLFFSGILTFSISQAVQSPLAQGLRGVSLSIDPRFPLGTDPVNFLLKRSHGLGFNAIILDVPLLMDGEDGIQIDAATLRPGKTREIEAFARRSKVFPMKVFFHFEFVDRNTHEPIPKLKAENAEAIYENFRRIVSYYAKLAQQHEVEGLVMPLGLESLFCGRPELKNRFQEGMKLIYDGILVMTSDDRNCNPRALVEPRFFEIALGELLTATTIVNARRWIDGGSSIRRIEVGRRDLYLGLGIAGSGEKQADYWGKTLQKISSLQNTAKSKLSFAARGYYSDPTLRGPLDETYSLLEKPTEELMIEWISKQ